MRNVRLYIRWYFLQPWALKWDLVTLTCLHWTQQYNKPKSEIYGRYIHDPMGASSSTKVDWLDLFS